MPPKSCVVSFSSTRSTRRRISRWDTARLRAAIWAKRLAHGSATSACCRTAATRRRCARRWRARHVCTVSSAGGPMADEVRRLSEELARDPASPVYLELGERLRKAGELDLALKVALRGLERHPHDADAHDLLARISVDRGELERAFDEWDMVRRIAPAHLGARKGMGYVLFKQGKYAEAQTYLSEASELDGEDETVATALAMVRVKLREGAQSAQGAQGGQGAQGAHSA